MLAQMAVSEYALDKNEQQQHMQQPLHRGSAKRNAAARCASTMTGRCRSWKADLAQFGKVFDAPADVEVAGVVDGRLSPKRLSLLVILLDASLLVIDVQRRRHAVSDGARAEPAGRAADHPAV